MKKKSLFTTINFTLCEHLKATFLVLAIILVAALTMFYFTSCSVVYPISKMETKIHNGVGRAEVRIRNQQINTVKKQINRKQNKIIRIQKR